MVIDGIPCTKDIVNWLVPAFTELIWPTMSSISSRTFVPCNGVAKKYTFIPSNCVNNDHTFQPPTHSSDPLFVSPTTKVHCPNGYSNCDWGTVAFPFHNLNDAIERASAMVTVLIQQGQYRVTLPGLPLVVNHPMILQSAGNGPVTMQ